MSAEVSLLGAVHQSPEPGRMVICGTEYVHTHHGFRHVSFYHVVSFAERPQLEAGDVVHLWADLYPDPQRHGRVRLHLRTWARLGTTESKDAQNLGYQSPFGHSLLTIEGRLSSNPRPQTFPDGELLVNFALHVQPGQGLLEGVVYGVNAVNVGNMNAGDRVRMQGRLQSQRRPDGSGSLRQYSKLELPRLQTTASKTHSHPYSDHEHETPVVGRAARAAP